MARTVHERIWSVVLRCSCLPPWHRREDRTAAPRKQRPARPTALLTSLGRAGRAHNRRTILVLALPAVTATGTTTPRARNNRGSRAQARAPLGRDLEIAGMATFPERLPPRASSHPGRMRRWAA